MKYNISAFTHIGTVRKINQDRILVQDQIIHDGVCEFEVVEECSCFVADGIGGNQSGEVASQFILEKIVHWLKEQQELSEDELQSSMEHINEDLLLLGKQQRKHYGASTTLVGLIIRNDKHVILSAGDSPMWLLRHDMFYQLTENQVINPYEKNSPLVSYFGGKEAELDLQFCHDLRDIQPNDIFLLCSDGLFKALQQKHIKVIIGSNQPLTQKVQFLLQKVLEHGAEDNVSCILVEILENV